MKVGLIAMAQVLPNVALMRLSAYHKALGDEVVFRATPVDHCDKVYISTLYTWQRAKVVEIAAQFYASDVEIGGSGWDLALRLPVEVDAMTNDYSLYGIDYGMGYSTRGCIRHCAFCPVPKTEGRMREDNSLGSLLNPRSNKLMLLDNNFFAAESWREKIEEVKRRKLVIDWPQGNDIRLMTPEIATALRQLQKNGNLSSGQFRFQPGRLHFAWDLPSNDARTEDVVRGVRHLLDAGILPQYLSFFVLVGSTV